jgi:hypothetical protein
LRGGATASGVSKVRRGGERRRGSLGGQRSDCKVGVGRTSCRGVLANKVGAEKGRSREVAEQQG